MRIACLQHVSFEGPGNIERWATGRGHGLRTIRLFEGQSPPRPDDFELLVVMGGPMSVHEADYPWLIQEKRLIAKCLERNKYILDVCLGSQLLATSLGGPVYRNRVREIGWFPIRWREAAASSFFASEPERLHVLHWHGETYDLPSGCDHLAESEGCLVQAFEHPSCLGLQFHLEATPEGLQDMIRHCGSEIGAVPFGQSSERMISDERIYRKAAPKNLFGILDEIEWKLRAS